MPNQALRKRLSLKSRLLLAATLWLSAMILAAGFGIPKLVKDYLISDVTSQLNLAMDEIIANLEMDANGEVKLTRPLSDPRFTQPYSGLYWVATHENLTLRSRSLWDKTITVKKKPLRKLLFGAQKEPLIYTEQSVFLPDSKSPINIVIGIDEKPINQTLDELTEQLWIILGLLFTGVLVLIGLQVSWSLYPLTIMKHELTALKAGKQNELSREYPKEVSPLVADLNALLFHYQELLERARHHAGNLSHALKTPLAVLRNEIQTLPIEEREKLEEPIAQIQSHIDYHLGRARVAGSVNILSVSTPVSERIDAISMAFDKVYAQRGITLINEVDSEVEVAVDPTDLDEMIGNLIENGYKWAESIIRIHSKTENNTVTLFIEDDGAGIPEDKLKHVIQRGVRLDETTPGTGLGLNIVSEMAHSYRGSIDLSKSQLGGLCVCLNLVKV
ncbi:ATP-binding protein [Vibrio mexicanus]|uniref:ATP-binding protein n=1 Tax=Vibrio mexicanus TaxID=1004326 RepID=UPI00063C9816|nr:ATP-binding protein [Vibrio mexicanus]